MKEMFPKNISISVLIFAMLLHTVFNLPVDAQDVVKDKLDKLDMKDKLDTQDMSDQHHLLDKDKVIELTSQGIETLAQLLFPPKGRKEDTSSKSDKMDTKDKTERLELSDMDRVVELTDQVTDRLSRFLFSASTSSDTTNTNTNILTSAMSGMKLLNLNLDQDAIVKVSLDK